MIYSILFLVRITLLEFAGPFKKQMDQMVKSLPFFSNLEFGRVSSWRVGQRVLTIHE